MCEPRLQRTFIIQTASGSAALSPATTRNHRRRIWLRLGRCKYAGGREEEEEEEEEGSVTLCLRVWFDARLMPGSTQCRSLATRKPHLCSSSLSSARIECALICFRLAVWKIKKGKLRTQRKGGRSARRARWLPKILNLMQVCRQIGEKSSTNVFTSVLFLPVIAGEKQ